MEKISSKIRNIYEWLVRTALFIHIIFNSISVRAYAISTTNVNLNYYLNGTTAVGMVLGFMCDLCRLVGAAIGVWSLGMFAMSLKSENPDDKQKALIGLCGGIMLMSVKPLMQHIGLC